MPLETGTKLEPYEITGALGAGGIGEVEAFSGRERAEASGSPLPKSRAKPRDLNGYTGH